MTVELASDSRDFATALAKTQLAEMTNARIVSIPQQKPKPHMVTKTLELGAVVAGDSGTLGE